MPPRSITRWRRITPSLARRWRPASVASFAAKLVFEATTAGTRPALAATVDGLGQAVRPEVEIMVAEGGGVVTHPGQELQFAAGLAGGGAERGPHAVVARVEHQHRTLIFARLLPLRDQGGQTREAAPGLCRR